MRIKALTIFPIVCLLSCTPSTERDTVTDISPLPGCTVDEDAEICVCPARTPINATWEQAFTQMMATSNCPVIVQCNPASDATFAIGTGGGFYGEYDFYNANGAHMASVTYSDVGQEGATCSDPSRVWFGEGATQCLPDSTASTWPGCRTETLAQTSFPDSGQPVDRGLLTGAQTLSQAQPFADQNCIAQTSCTLDGTPSIAWLRLSSPSGEDDGQGFYTLNIDVFGADTGQLTATADLPGNGTGPAIPTACFSDPYTPSPGCTPGASD